MTRRSNVGCWIRVWCATWLISIGVHAGVEPPINGATDLRSEQLDAEIAQLIERLGDSQYHARERAQDQLRRLGPLAFDALLTAQDHTDIEIAMRARYLVRSVSIPWTRDTDPKELKQLFKEYSVRDRNERITRARHFATLDDEAGIVALSRVVRFDPDRVLSKEAANLVLHKKWPETDASRQRRAELIRAEVGPSKRPGAEWLLLYARTLDAPTPPETEWESLTLRELELLVTQPRRTDRGVVRDLIRWHAQLLIRLGRTDDALVTVRRTFDLLGDDHRELYEVLDWSVEHGLHGIADELAVRFAAPFQDDPRLLYRLGESQLKRGEHETAEATANRARQLVPDDLQQHAEVAVMLQRRLLTEWAVAEFRFIVERTKPEEARERFLGARVRWAFADLLFDWGQSLPAAELVQTIVDAGERNSQVLDFIGRDASDVRSYMNYYHGMHFAGRADRERQMEYFSKAIKDAPTNPDILIAMFRVPNPDEAWSKDVKQRIEAYGGSIRKELRDAETLLKQPMNDDDREQFQSAIANKLNELAWLISNTEGDFQEALAASQRSLELFPDHHAFLDTLGRCYFAVGDLEHAIKYQTRAVERMPSMYVMQRQLKQFQQALANSKAARGN